MNQHRRLVLKASLALPLASTWPSIASTPDHSLGIMVAACSDYVDNHYLAMVDLDTAEYKLTALDQRGHGQIHNPANPDQVIAASRRPGNTLTLTSVESGEILQKIKCRTDRHFYGHSCFTANGEYVLTTENDFALGRGLISIRDSQSLKTIDEVESFGVGPHDIQLMPQGDVLVVANGGIRTHPDSGRRKLNIKSMQPTLTYIDLPGFNLLEQFHLSDNQLSIRHIDVDPAGRVGIATQHQARYASQAAHVPLIALNDHSGGQPELVHLPGPINARLNRYTADFCFDNIYGHAAISSPPGNLVVVVNTRTNILAAVIGITRPSALSLSRNKKFFVVSTAAGEIHFIDTARSALIDSMRLELPELQWDNHMQVI